MKLSHGVLCLTVFLVSHIEPTKGQVFTNKEVGKRNQALADSLKKSEWPYVLPIWGDKATKKGFNLPNPIGLSAQYFAQKSDLVINNLQVGFNNSPLIPLDGLVRFDKAQATASAFTIRPDFWLFPFLNVYAILGKSKASTDVGVGVWVKDSSNQDVNLFNFGSRIDFNATSFGLGMTPTIGVGGGFLALDMNVAWSDAPQLNKPTMTFVFGPRFGKTFKMKKPDQNVAVWVGGFRVKLNSATNGSINLKEVIAGDGSTLTKIDQGQQKVAETQQQVDTWWNGLSPQQQANPVNKAKYETANQLLERAGNFLVATENAIIGISNSTIQYSMDKRVKDAWNFITGAQFQLNKHFMIRAEAGFLGSRTQFLTGLQYRFGL